MATTKKPTGREEEPLGNPAIPPPPLSDTPAASTFGVAVEETKPETPAAKAVAPKPVEPLAIPGGNISPGDPAPATNRTRVVAKPEKSSPAPPPGPALATYRVWPHGTLQRNGKKYQPGDELTLHESEAASIPCLERVI